MKIYYIFFLFIALTKQSISQCLGVQLPASNDYVAFSAPFSTYTNSITVEAWIYVDGAANSNIWMGQGTPGIDNMAYNVWLWHSNGTNQFTWYINDAGSWRSVNSSVITNGWHHIATVADNVNARIYIDGVLDNTGAGISTGIFNNASSEIHVGHDVRFAAGTGGRNGNFQISELRVWSSSRTLTELDTYKSSCLSASETDLRLYNKFEDGTGSGTSSSETGPNGTLTNMVPSTDWVAGSGTECCLLPGASLNFDGSDDVVTIATSTNIPIGNSNYTIEAKIKTTIVGARGIVGWGNYGAGNQVNAFRLDGSGQLINYWWGNDLYANPAPINIADGNWHHVAATFDGTTRKIFVDGILKAQDSPVGHAVPNTANLAIGRTLNGEFFNGSLDEIRIWNRGLPQAEIQNNMNCELSSGQLGLVAYYKCNQGIDASNNAGVTTLNDASGNSNNGTLTNFLLTGATSNWIAPGSVISGYACSDYSTAITASVSNQSNVNCNGGSQGSATLTVAGTGPFTYTWLPTGGNADIASGLSAGNYTCSVANSIGGSSTVTLTITEPLALTANASATAILCNGGISTITVTANDGTSPYAGVGTFTMNAGTNTYTITDDNGCSITTSVSVTEPTVLTANASASAILCNGGISTITVTANDGTSPYAGTGTFTMNAGTSTYTITDDNGCSTTTSVSVTEPLALTANASATAILCNGGISTVTVTANDGTSPYNGTGTFTMNVGTSTYTITDDNGCSTTTSVSVTEPTVVMANSSASAILCNGGISTITVTANDGTAPYNGTGTFTMNAGTSTYTITDDNGCSTTTSVSVTEPIVLTANSSASAILCNGGISTITITANDGTSPYAGTGTFTMNAGTNTYTVTDNNGCSTTTSISVTEPGIIDVSISLSGLTITAIANGFTYQWVDCDNVHSIIAGETNQNFIANSNGNYAVIISDSFCSDTSACVNISTVGIKEIENANNVIIYPNPTNGLFTINLKTTTNVSITNSLGQIILNETMNAGKQNLDIQNNANGFYFVKFTEQGKQQVIKLIKE